MNHLLRPLPALLVLAAPLAAQEAGKLTLEAIFHPTKKVAFLTPPSARWTWMPDSTLLETRTEKGLTHLNRLDAAGKATPVYTAEVLPEALRKAGMTEAQAKQAAGRGPLVWNPTLDAFLVKGGEDLYLVRTAGPAATRLTTDGAAREVPTFSPDGKHLAFLKGNDLHVLDLATGAEKALTTGGSETRFNGRLDWVYDEEVYGRGSTRAFWWAPDSRSLAFLSFDLSKVPVHTLVDDRSHPQKTVPIRYPKAGEPNATVTLGRVDLNGALTWMTDPHPGTETLIVQVGFDPQGRLLAAWQDRIQTWFELRRFEGVEGKVLVKERSKAWQERLPLPRYLKDGSFLWQSDRSGFRHLYHLDAEGRELRALTSGDWDVRDLLAVDEKAGKAFFSATERSPIGLDAYAVDLKGKRANAGLKRLTAESGTHMVQFSPDGKRFLARWTNSTTPTQTRLQDAAGALLRTLDAPATEALSKLKLGKVSFQTIQARDGHPLQTRLIFPPDFDPAKRYPVFQEIYGGPGTPTVRDAFGRDLPWHHFLAQQGFVVWVCDNRSASNRGTASGHHAYRRLGQTELEDQLDGLAWLKAQGWADMNRVAIDGWSYGGFMSAYALTHSKAWKVGIVGAPVTDYRLYDSIYTERFMGLPKDNPEGYAATRIMDKAKDVEGALLLFHGTLDDNVHPQNTIQLVDALQKAGKDFELVLLPGAGHGPRTPEQVWFRYWKTWQFLKKNL